MIELQRIQIEHSAAARNEAVAAMMLCDLHKWP